MKIIVYLLITLFAQQKTYFNVSNISSNGLMQIIPKYSIYDYNKNLDKFRYGSKDRKYIKTILYKQGTIEDHHIIPKQCKIHSLIKEINFDVGCSKNIIFMPNKVYPYYYNIPEHDILIHKHGHRKYNAYVWKQLNYINHNFKDKEEKKYQFVLLLNHLYDSIDKMDETLPWN